MKILIVCTYYPPDTAIAAVRPFMFAKYLSRLSNDVTVLKSGIINKKRDNYFKDIEGVKVISYDKEQCEGNYKNNLRYSFFPHRIRKVLSAVYHFVMTVPRFYSFKRETNRRFSLLKEALSKMDCSKFDIVLTTYGEAENILCGNYIQKKYNVKWVMDYRDYAFHNAGQSFLMNQYLKKVEKIGLLNPNLITTVSDGISNNYRNKTNKSVFTIYNGFECYERINSKVHSFTKKFSFCYTGQIYAWRKKAAKTLAKTLWFMVKNNIIKKDEIELHYAGTDGLKLLEIFKKYNLDKIIINHGYLDKKSTFDLQKKCDIFLVFSWNTKKEQGILTGKFYEGICAKKPILSIVSGTKGNSELFELNNKYNYGFCYEEKGQNVKRSFNAMIDFICLCYKNKTSKIQYVMSDALYDLFNYESIVARLNNLLILVNKRGIKE